MRERPSDGVELAAVRDDDVEPGLGADQRGPDEADDLEVMEDLVVSAHVADPPAERRSSLGGRR